VVAALPRGGDAAGDGQKQQEEEDEEEVEARWRPRRGAEGGDGRESGGGGSGRGSGCGSAWDVGMMVCCGAREGYSGGVCGGRSGGWRTVACR
jgi:hypothetical protein